MKSNECQIQLILMNQRHSIETLSYQIRLLTERKESLLRQEETSSMIYD